MIARSPSQPDRPFHGLWSLREVIELKIKPFLDAQDVLVNCSTLLHAGHGNRFADGVGARWRTSLIGHISSLLSQMQSDEFALCRKAAERLIDELKTQDNPLRIA